MNLQPIVFASAAALGLFLCATAAATPDAAGKAVYDTHCTACHMATGEGMPGVFPPLKQSDYFKKAKPQQLVKILSNGLTGEVVVNGQKFNSAMPPLQLDEAEAAAVLNYVSTALNGGKAIVTPEQVKKLRAAK